MEKWECSGKPEHYEQFKQQRKEAARIIRGTKRSFEKLKLVEMQENFIKNNCRDFYQTFKNKLKGYQTPSVCFKNESGRIGLSNTENCEILAKSFDQLLNCLEPVQRLELSDIYENF